MNNISLTQINRNSNNVSSSKKTTEDNAKKTIFLLEIPIMFQEKIH